MDPANPPSSSVNHSIMPLRYMPPVTGKLYLPPERLMIQLLPPAREHQSFVLNLIAPVGYGKTSFASAVSRSQGVTPVWLTLFDDDVSGNLFQTDILHSFAAAGIVARAVDILLQTLPELSPICLVLDNLHYLHSSRIPLVQNLFSSLPAGSILIACADEDHSLPLSRLRMEERVIEFRRAELAASPAEAAGFFERLGTPISAEEINRILQKTDGWWACLRLFAASWRKKALPDRQAFLKSFTATDRFIAEFLSETIDSHLHPEQRELLRSISICSGVKEELAVTLARSSPESIRGVFRELENRDLLIPLGHGWYRMPVMLKQYYNADLDRESRRRLHACAAEWFEQEQMHRLADHHRSRCKQLQKHREGSPLGNRETEILSLAARGMSNAEIGERLFISTGTVKWHMNNILQKLNCSNRTAAADIARTKGYIS